MMITDNPGLMWPKIDDEPEAFRLAMAGSFPDTTIDYLTIGMFGARFLLERYPELVVARYKLSVTPPAAEALLTEIGRSRGGLRKGGTVDLHKAAEIFVHEFRAGVMGPISLEAPAIGAAMVGGVTRGASPRRARGSASPPCPRATRLGAGPAPPGRARRRRGPTFPRPSLHAETCEDSLRVLHLVPVSPVHPGSRPRVRS